MKMAMIIGMIAGMLGIGTGCTSLRGGFFGAVQTADEILAAKYGIPVGTVRQVRTLLGIPDARTLPGPERVLPEGLELVYDILDGNNVVVDVSLYHRAPEPRIVAAGTVKPSIFDSTPGKSGKQLDVEAVLKLIQTHANLLKGVKEEVKP